MKKSVNETDKNNVMKMIQNIVFFKKKMITKVVK